jgi:hypothetical protein
MPPLAEIEMVEKESRFHLEDAADRASRFENNIS